MSSISSRDEILISVGVLKICERIVLVYTFQFGIIERRPIYVILPLVFLMMFNTVSMGF